MGFRRNRRWQILGNDHQAVGPLDHNPLAARLYHALRVPFAQHAADCVAGGACHVGKILPGEGQIYQDATVHFPSRLPRQSQQRPCYPPLDALGCQLPVPILELLYVTGHEAQSVDRKMREALHKREERSAVPGQEPTFLRCLRGGGVAGTSDRCDRPDGFTGARHTQ